MNATATAEAKNAPVPDMQLQRRWQQLRASMSELDALQQILMDQDRQFIIDLKGDAAPGFLADHADQQELVDSLTSWTEHQVMRACPRDIVIASIFTNPDPAQGSFHGVRRSEFTIAGTGSDPLTLSYITVMLSLGREILERPREQIEAVIAHELGHMMQCVDEVHMEANVPFPAREHQRMERIWLASPLPLLATLAASFFTDAAAVAFLGIAAYAAMLLAGWRYYEGASYIVQAREYDADARSLELGGSAQTLSDFLTWSQRSKPRQLLAGLRAAYLHGKYYHHPSHGRRLRAIRKAERKRSQAAGSLHEFMQTAAMDRAA